MASGGTEANIEALWIYRNYFIQHYHAEINQIGVIYSEDSHYSISKGINLLNLQSILVSVDKQSRELIIPDMEKKIDQALAKGINYFIINVNLSTTMFGSVDDIDNITNVLSTRQLTFKLHVDAAFGGFIYPFSNPGGSFTFKNPHISSFTIDGHKMLQTPYGTGIFLIRKGLMQYVKTSEAQYVPGTDHTLCGSRSGANAIAVWMILHNYGSEGWKAKIQSLVDRTTDVCCQLHDLGIRYYRNPHINIIAINAKDIPAAIAEKYFLVSDSYEQKPSWWKIVVMPHITRGIIDSFINDLKKGERERNKPKNHNSKLIQR